MLLLGTIFSFLLVASALGNPLLGFPNEFPTISYDEEDQGYRISNYTKPTRYDVHLTTNVHAANFAFTGEVIIQLTAINATNYIQLHYKSTTMDSIELFNSDGEPIETTYSTESGKNFLNIFLNNGETLEIGQNYRLEIKYRGTLRSTNAGFYRSSYRDEAGMQRWLATTQFESTDARHAFPCYDEPGIRAVFAISITHHESYTAISNMPGTTGESNEEGMVTTVFEDTPPVQPYLIAFVVSDFTFVENKLKNQRVFARPQAIAAGEGDFALEAGVRVLEDQEEYVYTNYSLPKMDQISVPDFSAGAMENWGLVTYREVYLLYNKEKHPLRNKNNILTVIAHEFGHQFFGNRVSPKWWSYLWLNEGFATLFEFLSADRAYPEFRDLDLFVVGTMHGSLISDSSESTRPMTRYVESPTGIQLLFDSVAYAKSGSVLMMWLHALTENTFRLGLKYYLEEMEFQAADSDDLARNLNRAAHEHKTIDDDIDFKSIVDSWSLQRGFPIVKVDRDDQTIRLSQERYLAKSNSRPDDSTWWIPYSIATKSDPDFEDTSADGWIRGQKSFNLSLEELEMDKDDWLILNKQQRGFYRVNYDRKGWDLIIRELNEGDFEKIHILNRAQLIDDAFSLARTNRQSYEVAFSVGLFLRKEIDYVPWAPANRAFNYLNQMLGASTFYPLFRRYIQEAVTPLYLSLGSTSKEDDVLFDRLARSIAIEWACLTGNRDCLENTKQRLKDAIGNKTDIEPDLQTIVYCNGIRGTEREEWNWVWQKLQSNSGADQSQRSMAISALGCSTDEDTLWFYLNSTVEEGNVEYSRSERGSVLSSVYTRSAIGLEIAIDFLTVNYRAVNSMYSIGALLTACNGISGRITGEQQYEKFDILLTTLVEEGLMLDIIRRQYLDASSENFVWLKANEEEIAQFFTNFYRDSASGSMVSVVVLTIMFIVSRLL